jgi:hypothetical protein
MHLEFGEKDHGYGPGVYIRLSGDEVAIAIDAYLVAHGYYVSGARTIRVNGELCERGQVYIDPSGNVIHDGKRWTGRGEIQS